MLFIKRLAMFPSYPARNYTLGKVQGCPDDKLLAYHLLLGQEGWWYRSPVVGSTVMYGEVMQ